MHKEPGGRLGGAAGPAKLFGQRARLLHGIAGFLVISERRAQRRPHAPSACERPAFAWILRGKPQTRLQRFVHRIARRIRRAAYIIGFRRQRPGI